jgi:muramoyltetrapeptide carboxypeptidase
MDNSHSHYHSGSIIPPYLQPGAVVGITCPAGYVSAERVAYAVTVLERWGFRVKMGKTVGSEFHYFSGTDEERRADLQDMLDDPEVNAILMGRGGYGMSRIIDDLDLSGFLRHPKWVCGFSDITVLHSHLDARYHAATLHSPMCGAFKPETEHEAYLRTLHAALTGAAIHYRAAHCSYNRAGMAEGVLTGGNLSLLVHLIGSASEIDTEGKILFVEDIGEHLYKVDRMMLTLKRAGKLDGLKGIIFGGFTDMEDTDRPFGQTIEQILHDKVAEYSYPVCFHFPAGHQEVNHTLVLGGMHRLAVTATGSTLELFKRL